ncbi:MAG: transglycosylase domain-containing protein [Verrucomicrobiota bacterium]
MSTWKPITPPPFWKRWLPAWSHGPVKAMFIAGICAAAIALAGALFYYLLASRYDLAKVAELPADPTFYDRKGRELKTVGSSNQLADRAEIPGFLVKALMAREDARFFEHNGVDFRGLARATLRNLKDRDFTQGASTLTMQLAKNTYDNRADSIHRKLLEMAIALRIERRYRKDEILTHYLNRIYFGSGANGINQAAWIYFGKNPAELSPGECALLAGIIRGPHIFSPRRRPQAALEQRRQTLANMLRMGFITQADHDAAVAEPLRLADNEDADSQTSYAIQAARRELTRILEDRSFSDVGLKVHTTLDAAWQARLEDELNHAVADLESEKSWRHPLPATFQRGEETSYLQYAAITTETKTGGVLALIGGRDFTHSRFDRTRSRRDLGSAFEPFIAAAAAERGKLVIPGQPVQTGRQIGPEEVARLAKRCGLDGDSRETEDLFRGAVTASPREMAVGLATLGNAGKRPALHFIRRIIDESGREIYQATTTSKPALSAAAAKDALSVLRRRAGTRVFTGATGSERDAWMLRLGPTGSTAVWLGFDQPAVIAPEKRLRGLLDEFVERLGNE